MAAMYSAGSGSPALASSQRELDAVLNGDYRQVFSAQDYFSVGDSVGHIFDVVNGNGTMRSNLRGDELVEMVKVS